MMSCSNFTKRSVNGTKTRQIIQSAPQQPTYILKSCLRKYFPTNFGTVPKLKGSATGKTKYQNQADDNTLGQSGSNNNTMGKKRVSFSPETVMVDRESKPYNRMLPRQTRHPQMPDLFSGFIIPEFDQAFLQPPAISSPSAISRPLISGEQTSALTLANTQPKVNEYTKFTLAKKTPDHALHTEMDRLPARVKRLFENIENLQVAHVAYNSLQSPEVREKFLLDQVIRRQIVSLEISMSEGLIHFAMDIVDSMFECAQFIRSLFYQDYYNSDGSHTILPIIMNNKADDYINKLAPVVYALNRISGDKKRSDNSGMTIETVCTKLQLEMISLTICPAKSLMTRSILEVVPATAMKARELLEAVESKACIKWINNSLMRKDYTKILLSFHLIDKHDITTKFPASKKTKKSRSKDIANNNIVSNTGKKSTLAFRAAITSSNPAEKGDISTSLVP